MNFRAFVFVVAVVAGGWIIGALNVPGEWYAGLVKPSFNPPGWVFGPVWTLLYILIGLAGWRTWQRVGWGWPFRVWGIQMALNYAWSPVFFSLQRLDLAFAVLLALLASLVIFAALRWRDDRVSSYLFLPYIAWVCFAGVLNWSLILLNTQ